MTEMDKAEKWDKAGKGRGGQERRRGCANCSGRNLLPPESWVGSDVYGLSASH